MLLNGPGWTTVDARERLPDLQALLERCRGFFVQEYGRPARPDEVQQILAEGPPELVAGKRTLALLREGAVIGILDLLPGHRRAREAYLGLLVLDEGARGRGVGREVMAALEATLAAEGFDSLRLAATEQNAAGRRFWASLGFEVVGVFPPRLVGDRETVLYELAKALVQPAEPALPE